MVSRGEKAGMTHRNGLPCEEGGVWVRNTEPQILLRRVNHYRIRAGPRLPTGIGQGRLTINSDWHGEVQDPELEMMHDFPLLVSGVHPCGIQSCHSGIGHKRQVPLVPRVCTKEHAYVQTDTGMRVRKKERGGWTSQANILSSSVQSQQQEPHVVRPECTPWNRLRVNIFTQRAGVTILVIPRQQGWGKTRHSDRLAECHILGAYYVTRLVQSSGFHIIHLVDHVRYCGAHM